MLSLLYNYILYYIIRAELTQRMIDGGPKKTVTF